MTLSMVVEFDPEHSGRIEWAPARVIHHKFGIHPAKLRRLVEAGKVRRKSTGSSRQSQTLFNCDDVRSYLANPNI